MQEGLMAHQRMIFEGDLWEYLVDLIFYEKKKIAKFHKLRLLVQVMAFADIHTRFLCSKHHPPP